jgi:uncharacterized Zn-binding protein involved in type VI secretion
MAEGSDAAPGGLGVPLYGDFEIKQRTAATDVMTITGAASQTGDYIVCQNSSGTEEFIVAASGNVTVAGTLGVTGVATFTAKPILNAAVATTAVTTGMTANEIFFYDAANVRQFAVAVNDGSFWRVAMTNN